jgi:hypothetical protein
MSSKKIRHDDIITKWVRHFINTRSDSDHFRAGDDSGEAPYGVKIIFDGYGENDDGSDNRNIETFAVFVHKDSLTQPFKPHDNHILAIIHRPKEECYIHVVWEVDKDHIEVVTYIEDENDNCTQLDRKFVTDLIHKIDER